MTLTAVRSWLGRPVKLPMARQLDAPPPDRPAAADAPPEAAVGPPAWSRDRLAATDALWGAGYQFPGGEIETLRLAKPLGLSAASSLLLLGAGGGGPSCSLVTKMGAWVSGFEMDPDLKAAAEARIARANLAKRAPVDVWSPDAPSFRDSFFHHAMLLEALNGHRPEPVLAAIAAALKPNGQLMMTELVADPSLDPADARVQAWARLERRDPAGLPSEVAITRILGRLRFDVRVAEDVSPRHIHQTLMGWRTMVRHMEAGRPSRRQAMTFVREAELWLLRLRLIQMGQLRLVRWHAIGPAG